MPKLRSSKGMAAQPAEDQATTVLTCKGDITDPAFPNRLRKIVCKLKRLACDGKSKDVQVKKVEPWNSVRLTFNIPHEAALRLKQLAERGDDSLKELRILSVQIEDGQAITLTLSNGSICNGRQDLSVDNLNEAAARGNSLEATSSETSTAGTSCSNSASLITESKHELNRILNKERRYSKETKSSPYSCLPCLDSPSTLSLSNGSLFNGRPEMCVEKFSEAAARDCSLDATSSETSTAGASVSTSASLIPDSKHEMIRIQNMEKRYSTDTKLSQYSCLACLDSPSTIPFSNRSIFNGRPDLSVGKVSPVAACTCKHELNGIVNKERRHPTETKSSQYSFLTCSDSGNTLALPNGSIFNGIPELPVDKFSEATARGGGGVPIEAMPSETFAARLDCPTKLTPLSNKVVCNGNTNKVDLVVEKLSEAAAHCSPLEATSSETSTACLDSPSSGDVDMHQLLPVDLSSHFSEESALGDLSNAEITICKLSDFRGEEGFSECSNDDRDVHSVASGDHNYISVILKQ
ncbi:Nuclear receptor coactivator 6 [Halotydeus destructor]|nr:Nuclear receptor coactivator 6 [Halotydeus destructor]